MDDETMICNICHGEIEDDENYCIMDGEYLCAECAMEHTTFCNHCETRIWREDNAGSNDFPLCERCYDDHYTTCEGCGAVIHYNDANYFDDEDDYAYCNDCFYKRKYSHIRPYTYKPVPIFFGEGERYFGVELEIDYGGKYDSDAVNILEAANDGDDDHIYIKHDGSLNDGMEIVTHPMTLDYHKNYMPWLDVAETAIKLGYRSHKTSTCGLHIHVNRKSFGETREIQDNRISRVLYFVEHHWTELLKFSRRTEEQMNRWAARYGYKHEPKELLEHAKIASIGRYACVNLTNWETIEFRMFRGTLKLNTIIATLELVNIICDLAINCSDIEFQQMSWTGFVENIDEQENPELITYLKERRLYINEKIEYEEDD